MPQVEIRAHFAKLFSLSYPLYPRSVVPAVKYIPPMKKHPQVLGVQVWGVG